MNYPNQNRGWKGGRKIRSGRKITIPDKQHVLFDWFVDICGTLKAQLPTKMFKAQCKSFCDQWLTQQDEVIHGEKLLSSQTVE